MYVAYSETFTGWKKKSQCDNNVDFRVNLTNTLRLLVAKQTKVANDRALQSTVQTSVQSLITVTVCLGI